MKKFISIILLGVLLASCSSGDELVKEVVAPKYVKTKSIEQSFFKENLNLIGKVESKQKTDISPLTSGKIESINVNIGDEVKMGDILASIDTKGNMTDINLNNATNVYNNTLNIYSNTKDVLEKNIISAKLQLDNAKIAKENTYSSTKKQLEILENQLAGLKNQNSNAQNSSDTSLILAQESVKNATLALENFETNYIENLNNLNSKRDSLINNIKVSIDGAFSSIDSGLTFVDQILGQTDKNKDINNDYEIYLSAKNTEYKTSAENLFNQNNSKFAKLKQNYNSNMSGDDLINFYNELGDISDEMVKLYSNMTQVFDNTITTSSLNETMLSNFKLNSSKLEQQMISLKGSIVSMQSGLKDLDNSINSAKVNYNTGKASLEQAIVMANATLNNTKNQLAGNLDNLGNNISTTKIQLENTISNIKSQRETADNAFKIAQNRYNQAIANQSSQLSSIKSQLDNASGQKNSSYQALENALIKAPYDGKITSKNISVGQSVSPQMIAFSISNSNKKIIKIDISGDNAKYLSVGQEVELSKDNNYSTGVITALSTSINEKTNMYPLEISISSIDFENNLLVGDFVDVGLTKIIGNEKQIIIPFSSLIVGQDSYNVFVVGKDNKAIEKIITIGDSNSQEVEVKSGLAIGEKIVVSGALNLASGDLVEEIK
ncbi:efflux RND transporter periplasmic adaptor subunit [Candidatus Gracilibacteria bacterium]|nr:efflux RND transporter periplasmic adaptor subunit [Candidatus Gracilibacteria bacterium]